jgi:hypothetical protein
MLGRTNSSIFKIRMTKSVLSRNVLLVLGTAIFLALIAVALQYRAPRHDDVARSADPGKQSGADPITALAESNIDSHSAAPQLDIREDGNPANQPVIPAETGTASDDAFVPGALDTGDDWSLAKLLAAAWPTADEPTNQSMARKIASKDRKAAKGYALSRIARGEPADDLAGALEFEFNMTKDPALGKIPEGVFEAERQQAKEVVDMQRGLQTEALGSYTFLGPNNLGGRTRSVAYDVRYDGAANRIILACGVSGGVYKSTDDGANWVRKSPTGEHFSCTSLAQDPRPGSQDTWYYSVGETLGNSASLGSAAFYLGNGVYKSVNNGETWSRLTASNTGVLEAFDDTRDLITKVVVDPTTGHVYMAGLASIWQSTNGGTAWTSVLSGTANNTGQTTDIVVTSTGRLYAAFAGFNTSTVDGVWTSPSGGTGTWTQIAGTGNGGSPLGWNGDSAYGRVVLGLAPSNQNIVYALYYAGDSNCAAVAAPEAELFRWDQGATAWTNLSATLPNEAGCSNGNDPFAVQGGYDLVVAVKPDDPATIFIGGTNIYRSTNTGATWTRMGGYAGPTGYAQYANSHSDIHALVFQPGSTTTMLSGNDGGIQRTTNNLAANVAWTPINSGYRTYQYYYAVNDPRSGNTKVLGGAQDNGTTRNIGGVGSSFESVLSGDGVSVGLTDLIGGVQFEYVGFQNGTIIRRLSTLGAGFGTDITPNGEDGTGLFVTLFKIDPDNTQRLYYANDNFLYRTTSASTVTPLTWTQMTGVGTAVGAADISAIALTRGTYSAATSSLFFGTSNGRVFRLDDPTGVAAATAPVNITGAGFPANAYVSSIAVHPTNDDIALVTFSNYGVTSVFWTGNANVAIPTWLNVENNLTLPSFRSAAIVSNPPDVQYLVGTSAGLYGASNISAVNLPNWTQEGPNELGNVVVSSVDLRASDNKLLVGTHGYGMWSSTIGGAVLPSPTPTATVAPTPTATATVAPTPTATATVAPTPTATATIAPTPTATIPQAVAISGTVSYGTAPAGPPRFVPGVALAGTGLIGVNATTDPAGAYVLTGFGLGGYTVTPTKSGDVNGVSGLDAARVAQHVAGLTVLTANQQIAGDSTNNGGLSGLDAARIAQTAAGLSNPGIVGQWKFVPGIRNYASVLSVLSGQNFESVLVGDVTGNWLPSAPRGEIASESGADAKRPTLEQPAARNTTRIERPATVELPGNVTARAGKAVSVPIVVGGSTGKGIVAYDFVLTYDPSVLTPDMEPAWSDRTLSAGWTVVANTEVPGQIKVTAFNTSALSGSGALLNLNFKTVGRADVSTELKWSMFQLNEEQVPTFFSKSSPAASQSFRFSNAISPLLTARTTSPWRSVGE